MKTLATEADVQRAIDRLAYDVLDKVGLDRAVVVGILDGGVLLAADIAKAVRDCRFGFVKASSYGDRRNAQAIEIMPLFGSDLVADRHVVLVDDICDTGQTLFRVREVMRASARRVTTVVLVNKPDKRDPRWKIEPDLSAFTFQGDPWVIGYGMGNGHDDRAGLELRDAQ